MKFKAFLMTAFAAALSMAVPGMAQAPVAAKTTEHAKSSTKKPVAAVAAPSATEIADAQAKGLVWANTNTKVYHKSGASFGTTKAGKFMTQEEAKAAGYRAAKEPPPKKVKPASSAAHTK